MQKLNVVFYDPSNGQVINTYFGDESGVLPGTHTLPIPEGITITDVRPWAVIEVDGVKQLVQKVYQIEPVEVNEERARRIATGKLFDISEFGYPTPIHLTGDAVSQMNLLGLAFGAVLRALMADDAFVARLAADPDLEPFRDGQNDVHNLTSLQRAMAWQKGATFVSDMIKASWPLKEGATYDDELKDNANWQTSV